MDDIRLSGAQRAAVENSAGKYVYSFFLAALSDLYAETFTPDAFEFSAENGYDTFANLLATEARKVKRPMTVMRDAKTILASLFASMISVVNETGRLPTTNIRSHLANVRAENGLPVRFMISVVEALRPKIIAGNLGRDFDSVECFQVKIEALVQTRAHVNPGARELARIYVHFLKCVARTFANLAVEHRVTLNRARLRGVFRNFDALRDVEAGEELMEFFSDQLAWVREADSARRAEAKPAAVLKASSKAAPNTINSFTAAPLLKAALTTTAPKAGLKTTTAPTTAPETAALEAGLKTAAPKTISAAAPRTACEPAEGRPGIDFSYHDLLAGFGKM